MEFIAEMTPMEAAEHFVQYDVVASPANTIAQAAEDPHPWERGALKEVPDFLAGTIAVSGDFWHFSRTPAVVGSTPKVGEHNEEILAGLLGYSPEEIAGMRQEKVIAEWDKYDSIPGTEMA
jgi:crotonobetainyl-CoA:carnitine CoA-transferase CaiB-like acyl-CoA transferase